MASKLEAFIEAAGAARQKAVEFVNSPGMAPLNAFIRQGADEIAQALPAFQDSIRTQPELGQLFEITPQAAQDQISGRGVNKQKDEMEMEH
jgi:hypothetical protein